MNLNVELGVAKEEPIQDVEEDNHVTLSLDHLAPEFVEHSIWGRYAAPSDSDCPRDTARADSDWNQAVAPRAPLDPPDAADPLALPVAATGQPLVEGQAAAVPKPSRRKKRKKIYVFAVQRVGKELHGNVIVSVCSKDLQS